MRRWLLFIFSIMAFSGSVVAIFATTSARNSDLRGYTNPAKDATHLPFRVPELGINRDLLSLNEAELSDELAWINESNITWIRQVVDWSRIEPHAGEFQWTEWDHLVEALSAYPDLQLVAVLAGAPDWARSSPSNNDDALLQNPADYAHFAEEFASHYGETIDYYQLWDRVDENTPLSLSEYRAIVEPAYLAIHRTDAQAVVLSAELSVTANKSSLPPEYGGNIVEFYVSGGAAFVDGIATTATISPHSFQNASILDDFYDIPFYRDIMLEYGDSSKPLWLTTVDLQATADPTTLQSKIDDLYSEWAWLGGIILTEDSETSVTFTTEPVTLASDGFYPARNPFSTFSGIWNFASPGADAGWVNDSEVVFDFTGTDIALVVREGDFSTYLYPTIDGKPANALPHDSEGNAYLLLTSESLAEEVNTITVANGLDEGAHHLRIIVNELIPDEATPTFPLIGFAVSSGDLRASYDRQINVALITSLIAFLSILFTGSQLPLRVIGDRTSFLTSWMRYPFKLILGFTTSIVFIVGMVLTWGNATPQLFRRDEVQLGLAIATAGLIYLQPHLLITLFAGIVLFIIIYNHLEFGAMLTLFWAPFFLFPVELYRFAFPTAEIMLFITTGAWLLKIAITWAQSYRKTDRSPGHFSSFFGKFHMLDYGVVAWVILGIIAYFSSAQRDIAFTELRTIIIQPALYYAIFRSLPIHRLKNIHIIDVLIVAGVAVAAIGLIQFLRGEAIIEAEGGARRLASVYGSPNNVSLFLGRCIPLALAYSLIRTDQRRRYFAIIALFIMGIALLLTQSVGALLIGVPISIIAIFFLVYRRRAILPLLALLIVGIVAFVFALQSPRFSNILDFSQGTNFYRLRVWDSAINIIEEHPIQGLGLDQFLYAYRGTYILPDAWEEPNLSHPHNFVLDIWIRLGILGIVWFGTLQWSFWRTNLQNLAHFKNRDPMQYALIIGVIGAMINLLAHGLVDNSLFILDLAYVFMTLLAVSATSTNISAIDVTTGTMV